MKGEATLDKNSKVKSKQHSAGCKIEQKMTQGQITSNLFFFVKKDGKFGNRHKDRSQDFPRFFYRLMKVIQIVSLTETSGV